MRLGLIYNSDAGDAAELADLVQAIERHTHEVVIVGAPAHGVEHLLAKGVDAVVAAGGDGTIASGALALRGSPVPLGILPMGTANNIAVSLGIPRALDEAIEVWALGTPRAFDVGVATGACGERPFVESVGGGLVTHAMAVMDRQITTSPTTVEQLRRARRHHIEVLDLLAPVPWTVTLDGVTMSDEYLLFEVMNTSDVGPNLRLAPAATPCDARFTVVAAGPAERDALAAYLQALADGEEGVRLSLPTWLAAEVTIAAGDRLHVDDAIVGDAGPVLMRIAIEPGAVQVLAPPPCHDQLARARIDTTTGWTPAQTLLAPSMLV